MLADTTSQRHPASVRETAALLRAGELTVREATEHALRAALASRSRLNALISVPVDDAIASASRLDQELAIGKDRGPLHGIPIVHKDVFDTAGLRTTIGSRAFEARVPSADAAVVRRLREAGAVIVGKANMGEFACGLSGGNALHGAVRNPHDLTRSAGGSSGGTAAAVAAGVCPVGTGSDTGGSIRVPAFYNGVVGLRPAWGRLSTQGTFPRAPTLDVAGPLGRSVDDVALVFAAMKGLQAKHPCSDWLAKGEPGFSHRSLRIGVVENWTFEAVDDDVGTSVDTALDAFSSFGAEAVNVAVGGLEHWRNEPCMTVLLYEFARGLQAQGVDEESLGQTVRSDLECGYHISERTYVRALDERAHFAVELQSVFAQVDILVAPVMPQAAPIVDADPQVFESGRRFLLPASFAGVPAISVPWGRSDSGMPLGIQLIGPPSGEDILLSAAELIERRRHAASGKVGTTSEGW